MTAFQALQLPNGTTITNRIAKAAMEENMADADQAPSKDLLRLYQAWADGGAGLIITGNVMVDGRAMTGPGGVVLQDDQQLDKFKRWARIGRSGGAQPDRGGGRHAGVPRRRGRVRLHADGRRPAGVLLGFPQFHQGQGLYRGNL